MDRIALFLPNWVGDVVMATPALRALREHFQADELIGVMRPYVADVLVKELQCRQSQLVGQEPIRLERAGAGSNRRPSAFQADARTD